MSDLLGRTQGSSQNALTAATAAVAWPSDHRVDAVPLDVAKDSVATRLEQAASHLGAILSLIANIEDKIGGPQPTGNGPSTPPPLGVAPLASEVMLRAEMAHKRLQMIANALA